MTGLLEHVWQSTLCVLVAALLAGMLRRSPARTRHAIWLCASLKFLVPLALFVAAGTYLGEWVSSITPPALATAMAWFDRSRAFWTIESVNAAAGPAAGPVLLRLGPLGSVAFTWTSPFVFALGVTWAGGVVALTVWRWRQHRALSRLVRASTPLHDGRVADALRRVMRRTTMTARCVAAGRAIELRESAASVVEPGVFGILRATMLWPAGLADRLSDDELDAIVAHEMRHVARRDNLIGRLHMIVEILFWFYPLVWWIGTRLTSERERACDEEVLHMGIDKRDYAEGIVKVCGFCLRAPAALMAGVGAGSGLAARVGRILGRPVLAAPTVAARILLAGVLVVTAGAPIVVGASSAIRSGQSDKPAVHRPGENGVTMPAVKEEVKPEYTLEAMQAGIQGRLQLEAVVLATGAVGDVTVVQSLDKVHGLDDRAVAAMKRWRFDPGTKDGKPVDVRIDVEMRFTRR